MKIRQPQIAPLFGLKLPDDSIASCFGIDVALVTELRNRHRLRLSGQIPDPRASIAEIREQIRLLIAESRHNGSPFRQLAAAERAFRLALVVECEERRLALATAVEGTVGIHREEERENAALLEKADRWRELAEDYRMTCDEMQTPAARESLSRLARAYDQIADRLETRARAAIPAREAR